MEASVTVCQHHDVDRLAVAERGGVDRHLFDLARASRSCRIERPARTGGAHGRRQVMMTPAAIATRA